MLLLACICKDKVDVSEEIKQWNVFFLDLNLKVMGHEFLTKEEFKLWEVWVDSPASSLPPQEVKVFSPDYVTVDRDTAVEDFRERIKHYEYAYQPLSLEKEGWVETGLIYIYCKIM